MGMTSILNNWSSFIFHLHARQPFPVRAQSSSHASTWANLSTLTSNFVYTLHFEPMLQSSFTSVVRNGRVVVAVWFFGSRRFSCVVVGFRLRTSDVLLQLWRVPVISSSLSSDVSESLAATGCNLGESCEKHVSFILRFANLNCFSIAFCRISRIFWTMAKILMTVVALAALVVCSVLAHEDGEPHAHPHGHHEGLEHIAEAMAA
jgi:hypothetical protein